MTHEVVFELAIVLFASYTMRLFKRLLLAGSGGRCLAQLDRFDSRGFLRSRLPE
jgi:hypothetical protein